MKSAFLILKMRTIVRFWYISTFLVVTQNTCPYTQNLSLPYIQSSLCPNFSSTTNYYVVHMVINYDQNLIRLYKTSLLEPSGFLKDKTLPLTLMEVSIELQSSQTIEIYFRHICSIFSSNCTEDFLSKTIDKYRFYSSKNLLNALQKLFLHINVNLTFSWPILCLSTSQTKTICLSGKCYAYTLPIKGIQTSRCSSRSKINQLQLKLFIPDVREKATFNSEFDCRFSLCNNDDFANNLRKIFMHFHPLSDE